MAYRIDQEKKIIYFKKLTKQESKEIKQYVEWGYIPLPEPKEEKPEKEQNYRQEDILAFLKDKPEDLKKFNAEKEKLSKSKKPCKNGKYRKAGYMGALKWFRSKYTFDTEKKTYVEI